MHILLDQTSGTFSINLVHVLFMRLNDETVVGESLLPNWVPDSVVKNSESVISLKVIGGHHELEVIAIFNLRSRA